MANIFLNLPMPAGNGPGASVDTSAMGKEKSIVVGGTFVGATVAVEVSEDGAEFQPIHLFSFADKRVISVAAQFMRVNVLSRSAESFSGTADIGANDNGALFVGLPLPAGDGAGASVDVSALGNFTTFVVGGEFRDASISIEISEDGVAFASCGANFSDQGGVQNKVVVANFMRTFVRGRNAFPFTPVVAVGATNDPMGADGSSPDCLIYREDSAEAGPVVFGVWADLMAQLSLLKVASNGSGCYKIAFDDSLVAPFTGVTIPAVGSPHDMEGVVWDNGDFFDQTVFVNVADGATFTKLRKINGRMAITSLAVGPSPSPVSDFAAILEQVRVSGGSSLSVTPGGVPFFDFTSLGAGGFAEIFFRDNNSSIGGGNVAVILAGPAGSTLLIAASAVAGISPDSITGPVGSVVLYRGPPNILGSRHTAFLGTFDTGIFNRGPMGNVVPEPPAAAAIAPVAANFSNTIVRYDASGGAIAHILPTLPVSGGQEGGRARRMIIVEESGSPGVTVAPGAGDTINGVATPVAVPGGGLVELIGDGESNWYVVQLGIKSIFFPSGGNADQSGNHSGEASNTNGNAFVEFRIPDDFTAEISIRAVEIPANTTAAADIDLFSDYGGVGEDAQVHSETDTSLTFVFTANEIAAIDVSSVFSSLSAGDLCGLQISNNGVTGGTLLLGILLEYR